MNSFFRQAAIVILLGVPALAASTLSAETPRLPFGFVENRGQANPQVRFMSLGGGMKAWFERTGVVMQRGAAAVRVEFVAGSQEPALEPLEHSGASVNYFHGNRTDAWRTGLPLYSGIRYHEVWPGIDIVYRGEEDHLKAEYVVASEANLAKLRLRFDGFARIGAGGKLTVRNPSGEITENSPLLYQEDAAGRRFAIPGGFRTIDDRTVGFEADYDHSRPLVIDPPILFSGYFGGSAQQQITAVAVTWTNQIVVAGWTSSTDLPAANALRTGSAGGVDAFVAAFSPVGGQLIYCTYLGGSGADQATGIAVDSQLNTYVTGWTSSSNFPLAGGVSRALRGTRDAFVTKLNASGTALVYSTYFGGSGVDSASAIALDSAGNAVITGDTASTDLPVSSNAFQKHLAGTQNAFVARLNAAGNTISAATYYGGGGVEHGAAVALYSSGRICIGGSTTSTNLPTASAYQPHSGGGQDGFVAALASDASSLVFSTYLGGSSGSSGLPEEVNGIAIDPAGNVVAAGTTSSSDFPVTANAFQIVFGGQTDGFTTKFSSSGQIIASTFLGGSSTDGINAVALDFHGLAHVTGYTGSTDFPTQSPIQSGNAGGLDAFVTKWNSALSGLISSTYLGGSQNEAGNAIAVDSETGIILSGETSSPDFPASGSLARPIATRTVSAFLTKISPGFETGFVVSPYFYRDTWHVRGFSGFAAANTVSSFGLPGDIPVIGDWDGTGVKRIGVFRRGTWYLDINGNGVLDSGDQTVSFGQAGDLPVLGDWDGSGRVKLGLFRSGTFILDLSGHLSGAPTGNFDASFPFGRAGDLPVAGDWNGSGATKVGVFRGGQWLVDWNGDRAFTPADQTWTYGQAGDLPVTGDWDGSGSVKIGVYRNGLWILDYDGDHVMTNGTSNELVMGYGGSSILFKPLAW